MYLSQLLTAAACRQHGLPLCSVHLKGVFLPQGLALSSLWLTNVFNKGWGSQGTNICKRNQLTRSLIFPGTPKVSTVCIKNEGCHRWIAFSLRSEEVAFWTRRPLLKMQLTTQKPSNIKITDTKGIKLWPSILPFNTVTKTATLAVNPQLSVTFGTVSFQNTNTISSYEDSKCNRIWTEPRMSIYFHIGNTY